MEKVFNLKSQFEFFRKNNFVYLDNSATTQTPDKVINSIKESLEYKGNPHRGAHIIATKNEELIDHSRLNVSRFINCEPEEIVFTGNTTDSINLAIDTISHNIKKGDEIIVSIAEHHSNLLPFNKLIKKGAILKVIGLKAGIIDINDLKTKLSKKTKIISLQHCSNVLGNINPIEKIGTIIKKFNKDILYMVDGAQAIAHIPVDLKKIKCDFYSFSSHKMYGPDGIGVLFISKKVWSFLEMVRMGGGTVSNASIVKGKLKDTLVMDKFNSLIGIEGGTANVSNIIGLSEAINFLRSVGFNEIQKHEQKLLKLLIEKLSKIEEIKIVGPKNLKNKIGVLSFMVKEESVKEIGDYLNKRKIQIRYGSHCAFPLADEIRGETLRVSLGCYNDEEDIGKVVQEIKFYLDKKKGLIKNKNLEILRDKIYYKKIIPISSQAKIISEIFHSIKEKENTEVIIMAGHFLAIPDKKSNSFYPSIKNILPKHLHNLLDEFGMTTFPLFTWNLGCNIVNILKSNGMKAKLAIIANDTTGINELKNSSINKSKKDAQDYRKEFLERFGNCEIPEEYQNILEKNNLTKKDVMKFEDGQYYVRESLLRGRFKKFIQKNKKKFENVIDYKADAKNIDLSIKILDNQEIKTCRFDTFNSKTGGIFCIAELCQFLSELFGKAKDVKFEYLPDNVKNQKITTKNKTMVMFTPAMCDNAVTSGAELYSKLMLQEKNYGSFKFFNVPFGPDSAKYLATGTEIKYISDKDLLQQIEVEKEPEFPELWKLCEYNLLYNIDDYLSEMLSLFNKLNITKKSNILDTCVGPGFFIKELLQKGYNVKTADKSKRMISSFETDLKNLGIKHKTTISTWLDLKKHFKNNSFDMLFNRGNTFMYANGGWNEEKTPNKKKTLTALEKTLKIYYDLLKKGGYLYVDKYRDSEIPDKKIVATLKIKNLKEKKDIIFYVERKPKKDLRYAKMLLKNKKGDEKGIPNMAYDLTEDEMESLLQKVGFKVQKLKLKSEKHFVVWLAQKI